MRTCPSCGLEGLTDIALYCPQCRWVLDDDGDDNRSIVGPVDPGERAAGVERYSCGHEVNPGVLDCPHCGTESRSRATAVETPWGLVPLGEEPLALGRDPAFSPHAAELARWDNVSRRHAMIRHADKGVMVEDLYSANGTFIGELRLTSGEQQLAPPGTEIKLGSDPPLVLRIVEA